MHTYTKVSTSKMDEQENHSVVVVKYNPLLDQVDQRPDVGTKTYNELDTVHSDRDYIGGCKPRK